MTGKKFSAWLSTFLFCLLFWLLLTWSLQPRELFLGVVVAGLTAAFSSRFLIHERPFFFYQPLRLITLLFYQVFVFGWELIKANVAMAGLIYSPGLSKYRPGIIRVPVSDAIQSEYGLAALANSITLTPGTICMTTAEDDEGHHYYYIHWANMVETDRAKAGDIIKGTMEKWIGRIWA